MADEPITHQQHQITLHYTEDLINTAARRYIAKLIGWRYLLYCILTLAAIVVLISLGDRDWILGASGAIFVISAILPAVLWIVMRKRALGSFRKMTRPAVDIVFDDEGYKVSSDLGTGTVKWEAINKLWCFPEAWLVFLGKNVYSTWPTEHLTDEVQQFVLVKLQEQGTPISPKQGGLRQSRDHGSRS